MAHAIAYHALCPGFESRQFFFVSFSSCPSPRPYFILLALSISFPPLIYIQMELFNMKDNTMLY